MITHCWFIEKQLDLVQLLLLSLLSRSPSPSPLSSLSSALTLLLLSMYLSCSRFGYIPHIAAAVRGHRRPNLRALIMSKKTLQISHTQLFLPLSDKIQPLTDRSTKIWSSLPRFRRDEVKKTTPWLSWYRWRKAEEKKRRWKQKKKIDLKEVGGGGAGTVAGKREPFRENSFTFHS